jgi:hypothetical protein
VRRERVFGFHVEINVLAINGDLAGDDIITAAVVGVMQAAVTIVVPVKRITDRIAVLRLDGCPVGKFAVDFDTAQADQFVDRTPL